MKVKKDFSVIWFVKEAHVHLVCIDAADGFIHSSKDKLELLMVIVLALGLCLHLKKIWNWDS